MVSDRLLEDNKKGIANYPWNRQAIRERFNGYLLIVFYPHQLQELVNQERLMQKKEGAFGMGLMQHPQS